MKGKPYSSQENYGRYFYNGKFYRKFGQLAMAYFNDHGIKAHKVRDGAGNVTLTYK